MQYWRIDQGMRGGRPGQLSIVGASSIHLPNVGAPEGAPLVTRGGRSGLAAGKASRRRSGAVVGLKEVSATLPACDIRAANRARIFGMSPTRRLCPTRDLVGLAKRASVRRIRSTQS